MTEALLVVDMLKDFLHEKGSLYIGNANSIVQNVSSRLNEWRSLKKPVIYIVDSHRPNDSEFNMFPPHCLSGDWGEEIVEELAPQKEDYLIRKRRYSAFFGTDLDLTLRELGIKKIELTGVVTQICILYTAADARMLHYDVTVRKSCVGSFDEEAHNFALKEMEKTLGVKVL